MYGLNFWVRCASGNVYNFDSKISVSSCHGSSIPSLVLVGGGTSESCDVLICSKVPQRAILFTSIFPVNWLGIGNRIGSSLQLAAQDKRISLRSTILTFAFLISQRYNKEFLKYFDFVILLNRSLGPDF